MIDYTTIQTFPAPSALRVFESENVLLSKCNERLKFTLAIILVAGTVTLVYYIYQNKKHKNE